MKTIISVIGTVLIILGIIGLTYRYYSYNTTEKIAEIGSVKVTAEKENVVFISPMVSGVMLATGLILVIVGVTRK